QKWAVHWPAAGDLNRWNTHVDAVVDLVSDRGSNPRASTFASSKCDQRGPEMGSVCIFRGEMRPTTSHRHPLQSDAVGGIVEATIAHDGGMGVSSSVGSFNVLTKRSVRAFIAAGRQGKAEKQKLSDGGGLYAQLTLAGTAVWIGTNRPGGR